MSPQECVKCKQDDENTPATHHCPVCNIHICESHLSLHNTSNKTKDHASQVTPLGEDKNCAKCQSEENETLQASHQCVECSCKLCHDHASLHQKYQKFKSHQVKLLGFSEVPFSGKFEFCGLLGLDSDIEKPLSFVHVSGLHISRKHKLLFVVDSKADKIYSFELSKTGADLSNSFKLKNCIQLNFSPCAVCVDDSDDTLIITSEELGMVTKMSMDGQERIWKFGKERQRMGRFDEEDVAEPSSVVMDPQSGIVYVASSAQHRIVKLSNKDGSLLGEIGNIQQAGDLAFENPTSVDIDKDGNLVTSEYFGQAVKIISKKGVEIKKYSGKGSQPGQFNYPRVAITEQSTGNIYVGDRYNYRIQVIKPNGAIRVFGKGKENETKKGDFSVIESLAIHLVVNCLWLRVKEFKFSNKQFDRHHCCSRLEWSSRSCT